MARGPAPNKKPPPRQGSHEELERITGLPAVSALFQRDPRRAERLFYDERMRPMAGGFCQMMAKQHRPYRLVPTEDLDRIAGTRLHGGIVVAARPRPLAMFDPQAAASWAGTGTPLLVLDGVGNPHNLGAIARTMAYFGLDRLLVSDHPGQAHPSESAYRVAEGGLEWVEVYHSRKFLADLKRLRESHVVIGTALGAGKPLDQCLHGLNRPAALILGNEEEGLPAPTLAACQMIATIPGHGRVQSLNVAATAAILIHELAKNLRVA